MSFRWPSTANTNSYTLNLDVHFENVGRWGVVRIYDLNTPASDYNELRKTSSGQVYAHTDHFLKIWMEPMGRGLSDGYYPHGRWQDIHWDCAVPLINPTATNPAGTLIKENDEVILPNYWQTTKPTTLIGLDIETQFKVGMAHLYHISIKPGYWLLRFENVVK